MQDETASPPAIGGKRSADEPAESEKARWNSLEMAKLLMAAATPVALFSLGYCVSQQSTAESQAREDRITNEAILRDEVTRRLGLEHDAMVRSEQFSRERDLQVQAFNREKALRSEAIAREAAVRREAIDRDRAQRRFQMRIEFWSNLRPKLAAIDQYAARVLSGEETEFRDLETLKRECEDILILYHPFISPTFARDYGVYKHTLDNLLTTIKEGKGDSLFAKQAINVLRAIYFKFLYLGSEEVASGSDLIVNSDSMNSDRH